MQQQWIRKRSVTWRLGSGRACWLSSSEHPRSLSEFARVEHRNMVDDALHGQRADKGMALRSISSRRSLLERSGVSG